MKYNKYVVSKYYVLTRLVCLVLFWVVLSLVTGVLPTHAAIPLNPDPNTHGGIPWVYRDHLQQCNSGGPALTTWISARNQSASTSITVPYGTPYVDLQLNDSGATCASDNAGRAYVNRVTGVGQGVDPSIIGQQNGYAFVNYTQPGNYNHASMPFRYTPVGGFTVSGDYYVNITAHSIAQFTSDFRCIPGGQPTTSLNNFAPCPTEATNFNIHITVSDNTPEGTIDSGHCSILSGWVVDRDRPSSSINVHVYADGRAGDGGNYIGSYLANASRPDVNSALGVSGNHGFSIDLASNMATTPRTFYVYAIGVNVGGATNGNNPQLHARPDIPLYTGPPGPGRNPLGGMVASSAKGPACNQAPMGDVWTGDCSIMTGWALDMDRPSSEINIDVYADAPRGTGTYIGRFPTNVYSAGINDYFGVTGNHTFSINMTNYMATTPRAFYLYAIGVNSSGSLDGMNPQLLSSTLPSYTTPPGPGKTGTGGIVASSAKGPACVPTCTASANPSIISYGGNFTLNYSFTGGQSATLNPGNISVTTGQNPNNTINGASVITPSPSPVAKTTYTLTVTNSISGKSSNCSFVIDVKVNKPYLRVSGNDVMSGAVFAGIDGRTCETARQSPIPGNDISAQNASINTNGYYSQSSVALRSTYAAYGVSSSQYAVFASGIVGNNNKDDNNFVGNSGYFRQNIAKDVTFANDQGFAGNYGQYYMTAGTIPCVNLSTISVPVTTTGGPNAQLETLLSDSATIVRAPGNVIVTTAAPSGSAPVTLVAGTRKVVIAEGDVTIAKNIVPSSSYSDLDAVPSLTIIAKGNIYIQSGVTDVNATLIAYPTTAATGRLDTCSNVGGTGAWPANGTTFTTSVCANKLTISGFVAAKQILWKRAYGTLGPTSNAVNTTCVVNSVAIARLEACSAEQIKAVPSRYLVDPLAPSASGVGSIPVSTRELPPIY